GTGLAADLEALDLGIDARSALIDHAPHRLANDLYSGFLDRIILFNNLSRLKSELLQLLRNNKMRLFQAPACGQAAHGPRCLDWRNTDVTLADCHRNRLTFIPFRFK